MSTSIIGGLVFASILTLLLTPCLLMISDGISQRLQVRKQRKGTQQQTAIAR